VPALSRFDRVDADGLVGFEVQVAFQGQAELAGDGAKLCEAHVAELRHSETEIAEAEGETAVGVELGQEPGGAAVGGTARFASLSGTTSLRWILIASCSFSSWVMARRTSQNRTALRMGHLSYLSKCSATGASMRAVPSVWRRCHSAHASKVI
jgi:hypothetical protein